MPLQKLNKSAQAQLFANIKDAEGFRAFPYKDTEGIWTIGYGRNLETVGITRDEAEAMLFDDILCVEAQCIKHFNFYNGLNDIRKIALIELCYNLGYTKLSGFKKFIVALGARDYTRASQELLHSAWADQVGQRANRLIYMIETGKCFMSSR